MSYRVVHNAIPGEDTEYSVIKYLPDDPLRGDFFRDISPVTLSHLTEEKAIAIALILNAPDSEAETPKPAKRPKICIGCEQEEGEPHLNWCPVVTGSLSTIPHDSDNRFESHGVSGYEL